jgi:hypothetical protein
MKNWKNTLLFTLLLPISFFILGLMVYETFLDLILPKSAHSAFSTGGIGTRMIQQIYFSIALALIPIFLYITWRISPIITTPQKIKSLILVSICLVVSVILLRQIISSNLNTIHLPTGVTNVLPIENLHFHLYLFGGLLVGCLLSFLLFKQKK